MQPDIPPPLPDRHPARGPLAAAVAVLALAAVGTVVPAAAAAPSWPQARPIRLIVPFPPGSGVDIVTRIVAPRLADALGQQVVVDNRPGAGGTVGAAAAARAPADGYSLFMGTAGVLTVAPLLGKVGYDVDRDFAPISAVASVPSLLVVHPSVQAKTLAGLVALARARPGVVNYASTGTGTLPHLAAELLRSQAGIDIVHVPYKGSAAAMTDLIAGGVDMFFGNLLSVLPQVRNARLRPIAITTAERSALVPDIPTAAESGYPGFEAGTWFALLAPAGTAPQVLERIGADLGRVLAAPEIRTRLREQGGSPLGGPPAALAERIRGERAKWSRVLAASPVRPG